MIVLDASAMVEVLLQTPRAVRLAQRLGQPHERAHAPHLIDLEVASALRSLEARSVVTSAAAARAITDLLAAPRPADARDDPAQNRFGVNPAGFFTR